MRMRKPAALLSMLFLMLVVHSSATAAPGKPTTISFFISNPSGSYEFCIDSILLQFTDNLGDIKVITPMPVYPKVCICPPSNNSNCLSYADAGTAYGQSQGYTYASSNSFEFQFNVTVDPNAASSLFYPGVVHNYEVYYSYKFVSCQLGCFFGNPQQDSYTDLIYIYGLTKNQLYQAQGDAEQAANSLEEAQNDVSDAFNAIKQANSTIELSTTSRCISTSAALEYLSDALANYSAANSALIAAQTAYNSKNYDGVKYNTTIAVQLAVQTKNEAETAANFIQAELQRVKAISDKIDQANLSLSYSLELEAQAKNLSIDSYAASALNELALEYENKTNLACESGDYNVVIDSANSTMEKADAAKQILEPLLKNKLVSMYTAYIENLSKGRLLIGNLSANYSNSTIDNLTAYRDELQNGNETNFVTYIQSIPSTSGVVENTLLGFRELNQTIGEMGSIAVLARQYNQPMNFSDVNLMLQSSAAYLSYGDFNDSFNLIQEANLSLNKTRNELSDTITAIQTAESQIENAESTMSSVATDTFLILKPDLSESELALSRANASLYSDPNQALTLAIQARVIAVEQQRKTDSLKMGAAGAVIIIIILAVIIWRIGNPFRRRRRIR